MRITPLLLLRLLRPCNSKQKAKLSKGFFLSLLRQMYPCQRTALSKRIP